MKRLCILALLLAADVCFASHIVVRPADFDHVLGLIRQEVDVRRLLLSKVLVDANAHAVTFTSRQPLKKSQGPLGPRMGFEDDEKDFFEVKTIFLLDSPTIEKKVLLSQGVGRDDQARMHFTLTTDMDKPFAKFMHNSLGLPMHVYERPGEMVIYMQYADPDAEDASLKEWIYARKPNHSQGSRYVWKVQSEEFFKRIVLLPNEKGQVGMRRQVVIPGVDVNDYAHQRRVIDAIQSIEGGGKFYIAGEDMIGTVEPVFYITKEGRRKSAVLKVIGRNELSIEIDEPAKNYPILIESN